MKTPIASIDLRLSNRDGELYAVKTAEDKYYLVLKADTYHNDEEFSGMGSTEHKEISRDAFMAVAFGVVGEDEP